MKQSWFFQPQLLFLPAQWTKHPLQSLSEELLIDCLTQWHQLAVDDAPHIEQRDQYDLTFDFVFGLSDVAWFPVCTQKSMSHHQWWFNELILVLFENTQWCPDTPACSTPSDHRSAILAPFSCRLSAYSNLRWLSSKYCPFSCPAGVRRIEQSTNDHHTPTALPTQRWLQSCLLKVSSP